MGIGSVGMDANEPGLFDLPDRERPGTANRPLRGRNRETWARTATAGVTIVDAVALHEAAVLVQENAGTAGVRADPDVDDAEAGPRRGATCQRRVRRAGLVDLAHRRYGGAAGGPAPSASSGWTERSWPRGRVDHGQPRGRLAARGRPVRAALHTWDRLAARAGRRRAPASEGGREPLRPSSSGGSCAGSSHSQDGFHPAGMAVGCALTPRQRRYAA